MAGYSMGLAAGTNIPIEHLDYNYIGKCDKAPEIEKILRVLRSKKEGDFPELVRFTEDRLRSLKPNSKLLIEPQKLKRMEDLDQESWREVKTDIEQWEHLISGKDGQLTSNGASGHSLPDIDDGLPPVRSSGSIPMDKKEVREQPAKKQGPNRIKSRDYKAWDKYDANKEADKVDEASNGSKKKESSSHQLPDIELSEKEQSTSGMEREMLATREREKGNEAFKAGDYEEAHAYYTRSLCLCPTLLAYNNRAMSAIKLERYSEAVLDCCRVLQEDPNNTKGLLRKATAHQALKEYREAKLSLERILRNEPSCKRAQEMLNSVLKAFSPEKKPEQQRKGKKVVIQEVSGRGEDPKNAPMPTSETGPRTNGPAAVQATPTPHPSITPQPLPRNIQALKDKGNELFRTGQYSDALAKYSQAITKLQKNHTNHRLSLATLLSNRAACHLRIGDCRSCISDCDQSISINPVNLKSFMRRAAAYDALEKYGLAYNDYQLALRIDSRVDAARDACDRIMPLLRDRDGGSWRSKLPPNSDADKVMSALSAMNPLCNLPDQEPENSAKGSEILTEQSPESGVERSGSLASQAPEKNRLEPHSNHEPENGPEGSETCPSHDPENGAKGSEMSSSQGLERTAKETERHKEDKEGLQVKTEESVTSTTKTTAATEEPSGVSLPSSIPIITSSASPGEQIRVIQSTSTVTSSSAEVTTATEAEQEEENPASRRAKFGDWKRQGNAHVKKQAFEEALHCYSECIRLMPEETVSFTNRALCLLKLERFVEAEEDCSQALELEDKNVKALFRRVLARKALYKYQEALKDIALLKKLEPENKAVKKEEPVIKDLYLKQLREMQKCQHRDTDKASSSKDADQEQHDTTKFTPTEKKRRKVIVEEVSNEPSPAYSKGKRGSLGSGGSSASLPDHPDQIPHIDLSGIPQEKLPAARFIPRWNALSRSALPHHYALLLKQIPPPMLPQVITSKLDSTALSGMIAALDQYFIPQGLYDEVCDILIHLPLVQRFSILSLSPSRGDKQALQRIFKVLVVKKPQAATLQKTYSLL